MIDASGSGDADPVHADAVDVLGRWRPPTPGQERLRDLYLATLANTPDATRRTRWPEHLTASAVVLDQRYAQIAMVLHGRVNLWLPPGGHVEDGDERLIDTAVREAQEELGLSTLEPLADDPGVLDRHQAPCRPGVTDGFHLDVCFVLVAAETSLSVSDESHAVAWFDLDRLPPQIPTTLRAQVDQALASAVPSARA